jgi:hypothetical protein
MAIACPCCSPQIPIYVADHCRYAPSLPPCLRNVLRIVVALILNMANVLAFTRCDKDQKRKWATNAAVGALSSGTGGFGGRIMGAVMGRFFR